MIRKSLYTDEGRVDLLDALGAALAGDGGPLLDMYEFTSRRRRRTGSRSVRTQRSDALIWPASGRVSPRPTTPPCGTRSSWSRRDSGRVRRRPTISWKGSCWIQPLTESRLPVPVDAAGAPTLVVVGETGDVATPIEAARQAVDDLDQAVLIKIESDIHAGLLEAMWTTSHDGSRSPAQFRCVVDLVETYLIDLEAPSTESFCSIGE